MRRKCNLNMRLGNSRLELGLKLGDSAYTEILFGFKIHFFRVNSYFNELYFILSRFFDRVDYRLKLAIRHNK